MPLKICFLGLIITFLFVKCDVTIDPENDPPKLEIIGFKTDTLTYGKGERSEFRFKVSDSDKDKLDVNVMTDANGRLENLIQNSNGVWSGFYVPLADGKHRINIEVSDGIVKVNDFLIVVFFHNFPPKAMFSYKLINKNIKTKQFTYDFSPDSSKDPDGKLINAVWNFDGFTLEDSTVSKVSHTFDKFGVYKVTLKVYDRYNSVDSASTIINNSLPELNIFYNALTEVKIKFEAQAQNYDGSPISYFWDFGDSSSSAQKSPEHTYSKTGVYNVTCTAKDTIGEVTKELVVDINAPPKKPIAKFSFGNGQRTYEAQNQEEFKVDGSLSKDMDGSGIKRFLWYLKHPDNTEEFLDERGLPIRRMKMKNKLGRYSLGLIVINGSGLKSDADWKSLTIKNSPPVPNFTYKNYGRYVYQGKRKYYVHKIDILTNTSSDPDPSQSLTYSWYIDNKFQSKNPWGLKTPRFQIYPPKKAGSSYELRLVVKDNLGASAEIIKQIKF